jgi:hypothetical protein
MVICVGWPSHSSTLRKRAFPDFDGRRRRKTSKSALEGRSGESMLVVCMCVLVENAGGVSVGVGVPKVWGDACACARQQTPVVVAQTTDATSESRYDVLTDIDTDILHAFFSYLSATSNRHCFISSGPISPLACTFRSATQHDLLTYRTISRSFQTLVDDKCKSLAFQLARWHVNAFDDALLAMRLKRIPLRIMLPLRPAT